MSSVFQSRDEFWNNHLHHSASSSPPTHLSCCPSFSSSGTHHSWAYCLSAGLTPAVFGTDWKGASSARGQAPQDPAGCCSKCLPSPKSSAEVLSIRVWKQRLLLQNPPHHKLPLSLSVPLPVRIIFPVQLLFFTPACSFSLESRKITSVKVCVWYCCT